MSVLFCNLFFVLHYKLYANVKVRKMFGMKNARIIADPHAVPQRQWLDDRTNVTSTSRTQQHTKKSMAKTWWSITTRSEDTQEGQEEGSPVHTQMKHRQSTNHTHGYTNLKRLGRIENCHKNAYHLVAGCGMMFIVQAHDNMQAQLIEQYICEERQHTVIKSSNDMIFVVWLSPDEYKYKLNIRTSPTVHMREKPGRTFTKELRVFCTTE